MGRCALVSDAQPVRVGGERRLPLRCRSLMKEIKEYGVWRRSRGDDRDSGRVEMRMNILR